MQIARVVGNVVSTHKLKKFEGAKPKSLTLLGLAAPLRFKSGAGAVTTELPELPEELLAQPAWVLKLSR